MHVCLAQYQCLILNHDAISHLSHSELTEALSEFGVCRREDYELVQVCVLSTRLTKALASLHITDSSNTLYVSDRHDMF